MILLKWLCDNLPRQCPRCRRWLPEKLFVVVRTTIGIPVMLCRECQRELCSYKGEQWTN